MLIKIFMKYVLIFWFYGFGYGQSPKIVRAKQLAMTEDENWAMVQHWHICRLKVFFQISGPLLFMPLEYHSMVKLDKGQAILGGRSNHVYQAKIYFMTCSNRNCIISLLDRELSFPKGQFLAIPIPDTDSGCITGGKKYFF